LTDESVPGSASDTAHRYTEVSPTGNARYVEELTPRRYGGTPRLRSLGGGVAS
jgi:hypothetical protein